MDSFQKIQGKTTKCDFGSLFVTILQKPMSFFLIVFFFFCFSCNNYIPPSIPPTIVINKEDCKQTYKLSDIVQEYQLIPRDKRFLPYWECWKNHIRYDIILSKR